MKSYINGEYVKYDSNNWTLENISPEAFEPNPFAAPDPSSNDIPEERPDPPRAHKLNRMVINRDLFFHGTNRINMNEELMGATDISRIYIRYVSDSSDYKHYINNTGKLYKEK